MIGIGISLRTVATVVAALTVLLAPGGRVAAQAADGGQRASREQLTARLTAAEQRAGNARSGEKSKLLAEASAIRARLETGDFRPGDRFVMTLRQDSVITDTLVVRDSLRVAVLNLPDFSVAGVLRSELEEKLGAHVSRFLRNTTVRTTLLTRVSVTGAVRNPGFYYAVPDRPLNDLLTLAGGPLAEADINKMSITRMGSTVMRARDAKRMVEEGRTLEALDVQSGDTVNVPLRKRVNWEMLVRLGFIFASFFFAALQFVQWYYNRQLE